MDCAEFCLIESVYQAEALIFDAKDWQRLAGRVLLEVLHCVPIALDELPYTAFGDVHPAGFVVRNRRVRNAILRSGCAHRDSARHTHEPQDLRRWRNDLLLTSLGFLHRVRSFV